jgi:hypothetical protein
MLHPNIFQLASVVATGFHCLVARELATERNALNMCYTLISIFATLASVVATSFYFIVANERIALEYMLHPNFPQLASVVATGFCCLVTSGLATEREMLQNLCYTLVFASLQVWSQLVFLA